MIATIARTTAAMVAIAMAMPITTLSSTHAAINTTRPASTVLPIERDLDADLFISSTRIAVVRPGSDRHPARPPTGKARAEGSRYGRWECGSLHAPTKPPEPASAPCCREIGSLRAGALATRALPDTGKRVTTYTGSVRRPAHRLLGQQDEPPRRGDAGFGC